MPIPVDQQMANILTDMGHAVLLCMHRARAVTTKLVFPGILYSRVNKLCKHSHTVLLLVLISSLICSSSYTAQLHVQVLFMFEQQP